MPAVLFTASTWSHIANFHRPYLNAFRAKGWRVHVACGGDMRNIPEAERSISLPLEKKMTAPANFRARKQLKRLILAEKYDLIVTHTALAAFFTRLAAPKGVPVVNVCHGYLFNDQTPARRKAVLLAAEQLTASRTDLLLTMNQWDFAAAKRLHLGRRVENIPGMGVDFERFSADLDPNYLKDSQNFREGDFVLLYAAEFSARKNHAMLLRGLTLLPERVKLVLPGQGALLPDCRTLAETLGVADRVRFPGQVSDMPAWYAAADAAVSASRSEGLPFNIMEAMYTSLPVVASTVKGHTDLLTEGETGLLYPFDDEAAFAAQVRRLLVEPGLADRLGSAAHAAVLPYGLDAVLPRVMELYLSEASRSTQ